MIKERKSEEEIAVKQKESDVKETNDKAEIALKHKQKSILDKDSIYHFLFGCILGVCLGLLIDWFFVAIIIGFCLIPLIEYSLHRLTVGYSTLTSKNALADIFLANVGLLVFLIIFQLF